MESSIKLPDENNYLEFLTKIKNFHSDLKVIYRSNLSNHEKFEKINPVNQAINRVRDEMEKYCDEFDELEHDIDLDTILENKEYIRKFRQRFLYDWIQNNTEFESLWQDLDEAVEELFPTLN